MGWIMVMFDLPVKTKIERQAATAFRKALQDDGYMMINFSVYARPCVTWERMKKHEKRLHLIVPHAGDVKAFFLTDKQWKNALTVVGKDYADTHKQQNPNMPQQLEFW
ncbi:MAG: CRISPR-associated endonuclease Cas2 [Lentisphaeria bacterium]